MKFSCIIPVYNQVEYLPMAIESALDQTLPAEVIVIDDGSTDGSGAVADGYKDKIKVIHQVNKGLASARNTGIMNSVGDYILPLDADDMLMETCIEQLTKAAEANGSDVIASSFKTFGISNDEITLQDIPTLQDFIQANRLGYFSAVKRSVLLEIGGYNPRMALGWEDWDLWLDIFKRGHSLCLLKDKLVLYRTKEKSMITEANKYGWLLLEQMKKNHPQLYA